MKDSHASKCIYVVKTGYISVWTKLNLTDEDNHLHDINRRLHDDEHMTSENDGTFLPKNQLVEAHHNDVLYIENSDMYVMPADGTSTDKKALAIKMKMRFNERFNFLTGLKQKDRELVEDTHTALNSIKQEKSKHERKIIKWTPNGTIYKYENRPIIEAKEPHKVSFPGLTKQRKKNNCLFIVNAFFFLIELVL